MHLCDLLYFILNNFCFWSSGSVLQILDAHFHYVQGVAWDPLSKYVASLSSDRTCRIYANRPTKSKGVEKMNYVCQHVITKAGQHSTDDSKVKELLIISSCFVVWMESNKPHSWVDMQSAKNHLFHDETLPSFFRRLAWSPDGSFLLVPAGTKLRIPTLIQYYVNS